jgi:prefoldin subunit 5
MSGTLQAQLTRDQTVVEELVRRNQQLTRANQALRDRNAQLDRAVSDLTRWMDHLRDTRTRSGRTSGRPAGDGAVLALE